MSYSSLCCSPGHAAPQADRPDHYHSGLPLTQTLPRNYSDLGINLIEKKLSLLVKAVSSLPGNTFSSHYSLWKLVPLFFFSFIQGWKVGFVSCVNCCWLVVGPGLLRPSLGSVVKRTGRESLCSGHGYVCLVPVIPHLIGSAFRGGNLQRGRRKGTTTAVPHLTYLSRSGSMAFYKLFNSGSFRLLHKQGRFRPGMLPSTLNVLMRFCFVLFYFSFLGPHPGHVEVPRLGVESELQLPATAIATATWDLSLVCNLHRQHQILDPLSKARDRTQVLMDTSQIHFRRTTTGTPYEVLTNILSKALFHFYIFSHCILQK